LEPAGTQLGTSWYQLAPSWYQLSSRLVPIGTN